LQLEASPQSATRDKLDRVEGQDGLQVKIMRRAIDAAVADKPTMPQPDDRLWQSIASEPK